MKTLQLANVLAVMFAAWAVWELRRSAFGSRYDTSKAVTLVLIGLGAVLDSPLRGLAEMSYPLTGRYYAVTVAGHLCYLVAAAYGVRHIYLRLMSEPALGRFVHDYVFRPLWCASITMIVCFLASPSTSVLSGDHLYLVHPDGWLIAYWLAFYGTLSGLLGLAIYGLSRLRRDPRSAGVNLLIVSLGLVVLSAMGSAVGLVTGHTGQARLLAWPLAYGAIAIGSLAVVVAWRHRVAALIPRRRA